MLYVIYFDTNFESYSQLSVFACYKPEGCMLSTLIQILKAIHNKRCKCGGVVWLYVIYFDTNFESYSQRMCLHTEFCRSCMLSTLIQILKAIHNKLS